jgi:hypothetical protein
VTSTAVISSLVSNCVFCVSSLVWRMITCAWRDLTRVRTIDAQHDEQRCENVRLLTSCLCPSWLPQVRSGAEPVSKKSTFFPRGVDHSIIRSNHHGIRGSQRKVDILLAQLITVPYHRGSVFTVRAGHRLVQPVFVLRSLFSAFSAHTVHC